jgi:UDP:flavonoid glycosyltransferase YjiC (YdhE family)
LFTWEIGQGFGHVMPLLPIARELQSQGHCVIFALRDVRGAGAMLSDDGFKVLQAPYHPDKFFPANSPQPQTMADILSIFGFTSKQHLKGLAAAWNDLFSLCSPDVVVSSYAPLSLLCARHANIPSMLLALPFELPVDQHPSPNLRTKLAPANATVDNKIVETVNATFQQTLISNVHEIFTATQTYLMSFTELDCFSPRRGVEFCGSFFVTDVGISAQWPDSAAPKVFAYLNAGLPQLESLRLEIHKSQLSFCVFLRDASPALLQRWQADNVWATSDVVRLDGALNSCEAVLSYGGNGFISAALLAGKPIVFNVQNLEARLAAQQVVKLGAGVLPEPSTGASVMRALHNVLSNPVYKRAAASFAFSYATHSPKDQARKIATKIPQLCNK